MALQTATAEVKKSASEIVDFNIFSSSKSQKFKCFGSVENEFDVKKCIGLYRLITCLRYYVSLKITSNGLNHGVFASFINDIYHNILDDLTHFMTVHSNQIQSISDQLLKHYHFDACNPNDCTLTMRHYSRGRRDQRDNTQTAHSSDPKFTFYQDVMDSLHFYIFHLYDLGFRVKKEPMTTIQGTKQKEDTSEDDIPDSLHCIDYAFSETQKIIADRKKQFSSFVDRFEEGTSKYNLAVTETRSNPRTNDAQNMNDEPDTTASAHPSDQERTFSEQMIKALKSQHISKSAVKRLTKYINDEEFDTDAIKQDIDLEDITASNILKATKNSQSVTFIVEYFNDAQLSALSFATGLVFYYWPHYKSDKMYVDRKYASFKEEIVSHLGSIKYFDELIMIKANEWSKSDKVKGITYYGNTASDLQYGIEKGSAMSKDHVISLIVYCDFTDMCTEFSATFRAIRASETLTSIKQRNSEYWWTSKLLRETVECFGENRLNDEIKGPYFSGMSIVMVMPEFAIRLCSPTSTSQQVEVATRFAKREGMIIQLNNYGHAHSNKIRNFNCSWLSRYKEEDERLFIGGSVRICMESVRIVDTQQNFEAFFHALYIFDSMVNGTDLRGITVTSADRVVISKLIEFTLGRSRKMKWDLYIQNTFKLCCNLKKSIAFNLCFLDKHFTAKLYSLLLYSIKKDDANVDLDDIYREFEDSTVNLFRPVVFSIFKNMTKVVIYSTNYRGDEVYSLNLLSLMTEIISSPFKRVKIKASRPQQYGDSWLSALWSSSSLFIIDKYNERNLKIKLKKQPTKNSYGYIEDCVIIKKA